MINGERLRQVRELRGLTQGDLARAVGVEQSTIARAEAGTREPSDHVVQQLALRLGFPAPFFRQPSVVQFPLGSLLFRARASMSARERHEAYRYAQLAQELVARLAARVKSLPLRLPQDIAQPDEAAGITRSAFGLAPDTPIPNLVHAAEQAGVVAIALPVPLHRRDAFSAWTAGESPQPVVIMAAGHPGDRLRFSFAHELGHLVLHRAPRGDAKSMETEADRFASELLLPERALRGALEPPLTLATIAPLKPRWGVSVQTLVRRAFELELITERSYRYLFEQISARGWRTREPAEFDVPAERPRTLRKLAELAYGNPINVARLCADFALPRDLVNDLLKAQAQARDLVPVTREVRKRHQLVVLAGGQRRPAVKRA